MATESKVDIFNLALEALGHRNTVSSPTEASREAELCSLWYPRVYRSVGKAAHWGCLKAPKRLAQLSERNTSTDWDSTQPLPPWNYAHGLPADLLAPQYLATYDRFEIGVHGTVRALFSDLEEPILIYSRLDVNISLWDEGFTNAFIYTLGAMIARPLTGKSIRAQELYQLAQISIMDAREQEANDSQVQFETIPDWLIARGVSGPSSGHDRYFYPYGPVLTNSNV